MIKFACISPHPPIILPAIGSREERGQAKKTIDALKSLGKRMALADPDRIVISSPHPDWGVEVPLYFLAQNTRLPVEQFITKTDPAKDHFIAGKKFYLVELSRKNESFALVASGDLSHRLKTNGPYGLHPDGAEFDKALIEGLIKKDIPAILRLDGSYPQAGECGLRSFAFMLGILAAADTDWRAEILSYEAPFGVGYLVADFRLKPG